MDEARNPMRLSPQSVDLDRDQIPPQDSHEVNIELKNRASLLTKERAAQLESIVGGKVLVRDWKHTFEELLENEVEHNVKRQFPIFFAALTWTTDWRYRLLSLASFCWFVISFYVSLSECMVDSSTALTVSSSPFLMLCTTINTLANPWIFTGSAFNGRLATGKISRKDPASQGYYRLLEAQLTLIRKLGVEVGDSGGSMPVEGLGFKLALYLIPVAIGVQCILCVAFMNSYWALFVKFIGDVSSSSDCSIPQEFQYTSGFLLAPFFNAALSMYACVVSLCGLSVGASVCGSMTASWCARYDAVKYLHEAALPAGVKKHELRNDAYERYFLIKKFLARSSEVWNHYLVLYMLAFFIVFFYSTVVVYLEVHLTVGALQSVWQVMSFAAFVVPLYLVSTANASSKQMENMFCYSVPPSVSSQAGPDAFLLLAGQQRDRAASSSSGKQPQLSELLATAEHSQGNFSIIGGRNEWLEFVRGAPLFWTVLGLPVTFDRLTTFVLGAAVSLLAATLPRLLSQITAGH